MTRKRCAAIALVALVCAGCGVDASVGSSNASGSIVPTIEEAVPAETAAQSTGTMQAPEASATIAQVVDSVLGDTQAEDEGPIVTTTEAVFVDFADVPSVLPALNMEAGRSEQLELVIPSTGELVRLDHGGVPYAEVDYCLVIELDGSETGRVCAAEREAGSMAAFVTGSDLQMLVIFASASVEFASPQLACDHSAVSSSGSVKVTACAIVPGSDATTISVLIRGDLRFTTELSLTP